MISDGDLTSMESFGRHIVAGAQCVQLRGPSQFRDLVSIILFIQLRRLIVRTFPFFFFSFLFFFLFSSEKES